MGATVPKPDTQTAITSHPGHLSSPTFKPTLSALTGLRFLAAFDVVLYHFARPALPGWAYPVKNVIGSGYIAVSLFFLLSGFILSYSYLAQDGALRGTPRNFYVSRFARIYPAYLLGFLLAAPGNIFISLHVNHLAVAVAKLFTGGFLVLTLLQAWTPWTAWAWNFPAWSVSVEAFFYLLFPWLGPRLARLRASACLSLALGLWILSLVPPSIFYLLRGWTGPPQLGDHLQMAIEFTPLLRLPEFAIGILLGRAYTSGRFHRFRGKSLPFLAALSILAIVAFCPWIPQPFLEGSLLTPLFAVLIVTLAHGEGFLARILSLSFVVLLGEASYGIYIFQIPISSVLRVPPPLASIRTLVFYCAALITVSILSFRFVESPLRIRIKSWLTGPSDRVFRNRAPDAEAAPQASR
jgi:peptidoglycan/LPS O-acetylase OafA/YrhL